MTSLTVAAFIFGSTRPLVAFISSATTATATAGAAAAVQKERSAGGSRWRPTTLPERRSPTASEAKEREEADEAGAAAAAARTNTDIYTHIHTRVCGVACQKNFRNASHNTPAESEYELERRSGRLRLSPTRRNAACESDSVPVADLTLAATLVQPHPVISRG